MALAEPLRFPEVRIRQGTESGRGSQGTSSQYKNSYLDLAIIFVNSIRISENTETAMLSSLGWQCKQNEVAVVGANKEVQGDD